MNAILRTAPALVPMRPEEVDILLDIERRAYPYPWTRANFVDSLAAGYSAWTCRVQGEAIAYAIMMLVADEAHLLNLSVAPEWQRRGYGTFVMHHLFSVARSHGATRMFLEVRPSNAAGQGIYGLLGFVAIGRRRGYYPAAAGREDALVMAADL